MLYNILRTIGSAYAQCIFIKVITMKKLIASVLIIMLCLAPLTAFASAETLPADYAGNTTELIDIKNPEVASSTTANKACVISAVAASGTTVTLYTYNAETGTYVKMYADGAPLESVVGAAGLYAQNIELTYGSNNILVVASSGNSVETARLEVTLVKNNLIDTIRNFWQSILNP